MKFKVFVETANFVFNIFNMLPLNHFRFFFWIILKPCASFLVSVFPFLHLNRID